MPRDFENLFYQNSRNGKLVCNNYVIQKKKKFVEKLACKNILNSREPSAVMHPEVSNFMASTAAITHVSFLDDKNTILSGDSSGKISIHRLQSNKGDTIKLLELPALTTASIRLSPLRQQGSGDTSASLSQSFCVGLPNGDYFVYSTDEQRWSGNCSSQINPHDGRSCSFHGFRYGGSRRRYHRNPRRHLWDANSLSHKPSEIADWDTKPWMVRPNDHEGNFTLDPYSPGIESLWDFREVGSLLMAAHVDNERDCFTIMDHRTSRRPVVYCNYCPNSYNSREDITALCFASDNCVATSHRWEATSGTMNNKNAIKLWDIRMISKEMIKHPLPSFPLDTFCNNEPDSQWYISGREQMKTVSRSALSEENASSNITQLTPTRENNHIMITMQSNSERRSKQTLLFDPVREKILYQHTIHDSGLKNDQTVPPLVAISLMLTYYRLVLWVLCIQQWKMERGFELELPVFHGTRAALHFVLEVQMVIYFCGMVANIFSPHDDITMD